MKSLAGFIVSALVLSAIAFMLGSYQTDVYRKMLLWVTLALSYNFLFGIAKSDLVLILANLQIINHSSQSFSNFCNASDAVYGFKIAIFDVIIH